MRIRHLGFLAGLALSTAALAAPATAQQVVGGYHATIGPQDMVNSRGARIDSFCGKIQQDRANYHRFGRRDDADEGDPFFGNPDVRAIIGRSCSVGPSSAYLVDELGAGRSRFVYVEIIAFDGVIGTVRVHEGAG